MRGAPGGYITRWITDGIIPADAGSTYHIFKYQCCGEDHPRGCGEHGLRSVVACVVCGSSPRMRGAQDH